MKGKRLLILWGILCLALTLAVLPLITACSQPAPSPTAAPKPTTAAPAPPTTAAPKPSASPSPTASPKPAAEPIKIGALLPLTGPFADYGPFMKEGVEWRLEEAKYEFGGRPIKLIIEDETADPSVGLEKAKKLATVDKVNVIFGPLHSGIAMATAPYLAQNKIIQIGPMGKVQEVTQWGHFILPWGPHETDGIPLGMYAYDQLKYRKVTTVGSDYAAGRLFVGGAVDAFKAKGGTVEQQQWPPAGTADYAPYLSALKPADAIFTWLGGAELTRFLKQQKDFGIKMPVLQVTGDQLRSTQMKELGDIIVGAISEVDYTSRLDNPLNKQYVAAFAAKFGKDRNAERDTYCSYLAMDLILQGLKATNGDASFDKLRPAILNLKLDTAQGPLYFDKSGSGIINRYIAKAVLIDGRYLWDPIFTYKDIKHPAYAK